MAFQILLLNGPNLNMLGKREPNHYGNQTLQNIEENLHCLANKLGITLSCFQSNSEEKLLEKIHQSFQQIDFILINPAAFTHTSVALRDALLAVDIPFVEIHLSNVHRREPFRHHSYLSDIAVGVICGLGEKGYHYGLEFAYNYLTKRKQNSSK
ncbi:type II 3-dehydroquinate dehydratase [Mergibacter septicus]|uniref:3-dehydroquinate dehydratase n=1 Tax=Mergibacter septicus TaxID=221402 RepID=A0A8D4LP25_9PAST|nr:type II 3-dehydroquinate dehydratase [Mergibacter septicus]AWX15816.1 type II 3-dehydroquinate dehydratase [Mergibacter septicus]QDJ13295.1 type II 3-dehydroquinate dehydratase [Mergibacter septicus]QDJ15069.1 type II 3-dehydroquinate dehydratase [Mergibacter septicus]UTU47507.1 type II 3-dehydroquinate dehydratase [Mergibacter septicus]WMR95312.1 type II 3-dehydroquinate dehydratase [Mergibacter septicus]